MMFHIILLKYFLFFFNIITVEVNIKLHILLHAILMKELLFGLHVAIVTKIIIHCMSLHVNFIMIVFSS
jgi:hypothetical protein